MDTEELSKKYMKKYNDLIKEYEDTKFNGVVDALNDAISRSDMEKTNELYNVVLNWNIKVAGLEGVRKSLDTQFSYLHLPSAVLFSVIYDTDERMWKFNTEIR